MTKNRALVFGASGITGWSITNLMLKNYPSPETFSSVTALTNRPLTVEQATWPRSDKLQIVNGIDILKDGLEEELRSQVKHMEEMTHLYFFAYVMDPDPSKECAINVALLRNAVTSVEKLAPNLKFVVLPTGTKAYGIHLLDHFPFKQDLPLKESLPRLPEPYAANMFYYAQCDELIDLSEGKPWTWCHVVPDVIVGFVPNNNIYCLAQMLGLYLSLYAEINGRGADVPFPGTSQSWKALHNDSFQDDIAKTAIIASLKPEVTSGKRYNAVHNSEPTTWEQKWPIICDYFGLKGVGPSSVENSPQVIDYLTDHVTEWKKIEETHGLQKGRVDNDRTFGPFAYFVMTMLNFDRQVDTTRTREMMGDQRQELDTRTAWYAAFDRFRQAKIIP